jgi:hypothetical protein
MLFNKLSDDQLFKEYPAPWKWQFIALSPPQIRYHVSLVGWLHGYCIILYQLQNIVLIFTHGKVNINLYVCYSKHWFIYSFNDAFWSAFAEVTQQWIRCRMSTDDEHLVTSIRLGNCALSEVFRGTNTGLISYINKNSPPTPQWPRHGDTHGKGIFI